LEGLLTAFAGLVGQTAFSDLHLIMVGEFEKEVSTTITVRSKEQCKSLELPTG